ncbi:Polynucleotidyl transferase- ribonuclease H-like superfamily protein [Striga hermonthica]|uniref:Polynucleotidyl transferase- ribonuclease H-like superfamily protein n=1 Tax=Striga hermonthica TaxID=68872 RepID=A0A9N7NUF5_STRHE|nr:Polynucleotidyl transferase- ribonuclease H-like superfamily protein [Striga hermonthica]
MAADGACYFCGQPESMLHVLRDCSHARQIWDLLVPTQQHGEFFSQELCGWLWSNLLGSPLDDLEEWTTTFSIACWRIWAWRNKMVFTNKVVPLEAKIRDIRSRVQRYREAAACEGVLGVRDRHYESIMDFSILMVKRCVSS